MSMLKHLIKAIEELDRCIYCDCSHEVKKHINEALIQFKNYLNLIIELYMLVIKVSAIVANELGLPREIRIGNIASLDGELIDIIGLLLMSGYKFKMRNGDLYLVRDGLNDS